MKQFLVLFLVLGLIGSADAAFNVTKLSDLQKDVRDLLSTSADPYHPNDTLTNLINIACREVASYGAILRGDSVVLVAGDNMYSLNEDFLECQSAFYCTATASEALKRIDFSAWGRVAAATQATQVKYYSIQPWAYYDAVTIKAANFWIYPAHSGVADTLIVMYYAEATDLSTSTDTTNIPYHFTNLVVYYATGLAFARAGMYNEAAWWFALYDRTRVEKGLLKQLDFIIKPKIIGE